MIICIDFQFSISVMTTVISCSYAFMLPVATAPNALVYAASTMKGQAMICIGFFMNVICVLLTNLAMNYYAEYIFEDFETVPDWALASSPGLAPNCSAIN